MGELYELISELCEKKKVSKYRMCKDIGIQPSAMTDLKSGRKKGFTAEIANKIADYFGVTVGYLLGEEEKEKPAEIGELTEEEIEYLRWYREEASERDKALVRIIVKGDK